MSRKISQVLLVLLAAFCAAAPALVLIFPRYNLFVLALLSVSGWAFALAIAARGKESCQRLSEKLPQVFQERDSFKSLSRFIKEQGRYFRAGFTLRLEEPLDSRELLFAFEGIAYVLRQEFQAVSVELSFFDENSALWSKSLLTGVPSVWEAQSMSTEDSLPPAAPTRLELATGDVLIAPVRFAGTVFGAVRIQTPSGRQPLPSDLKVLELIASQCAIAMLDARFTDELVRMRQLGQESIQAKTGFLANLSHELRGPLGIILNGVELIIDGLCGPVPDQVKETAQMVKDSGEHLLDLVNDVLDYAKVEAGKITPKPIPIALKATLTDIIAVVRSQAEAKKHKLILETIDDKLGVACDKRHLRQILINFLTNAVKYTPDGGEIRVKVEHLQHDRVRISIKDSGIGIPQNQRDKVFSAFERVDHAYALSQVGTGLGMPLTRRLAEANGGSVDFESAEGKGSTFWVNLPTAKLRELEEPSPTAEKPQAMVLGNGETVLLLEPDVSSRQMLSTYLTHQGFVVDCVENSKELLRKLRTGASGLIMLENELPEASGAEIVSAIRSQPNGMQVPIVLLSSRAFVFDIERYLKLGVDRCVSKPFELSDVAITLRRLLDEASAQHAQAPHF